MTGSIKHPDKCFLLTFQNSLKAFANYCKKKRTRVHLQQDARERVSLPAALRETLSLKLLRNESW